MRAAVIDLATLIVINVIVANAEIDPAPEGTKLFNVTDIPCDIGWLYDDASQSFIDPNA